MIDTEHVVVRTGRAGPYTDLQVTPDLRGRGAGVPRAGSTGCSPR